MSVRALQKQKPLQPYRWCSENKIRPTTDTMREDNDHLLAVAWWVILNSLDLFFFGFYVSVYLITPDFFIAKISMPSTEQWNCPDPGCKFQNPVGSDKCHQCKLAWDVASKFPKQPGQHNNNERFSSDKRVPPSRNENLLKPENLEEVPPNVQPNSPVKNEEQPVQFDKLVLQNPVIDWAEEVSNELGSPPIPQPGKMYF